jgi:hypothetical protein
MMTLTPLGQPLAPPPQAQAFQSFNSTINRSMGFTRAYGASLIGRFAPGMEPVITPGDPHVDHGLDDLATAFRAHGFEATVGQRLLQARLPEGLDGSLVEATVMISPMVDRPFVFMLFDWRRETAIIDAHSTTADNILRLLTVMSYGHALGVDQATRVSAAIRAEQNREGASHPGAMGPANNAEQNRDAVGTTVGDTGGEAVISRRRKTPPVGPTGNTGDISAAANLRHNVGRRYGATVLSPESQAPHSADGSIQAAGQIAMSQAEAQDDKWREGAAKVLADITVELVRRGFAIPPSKPGGHLYATLTDSDPELPIYAQVEISPYPAEPFKLCIYTHKISDPNPGAFEWFIPMHSTTQERLLRTVDVFLAGFKARPA